MPSERPQRDGEVNRAWPYLLASLSACVDEDDIVAIQSVRNEDVSRALERRVEGEAAWRSLEAKAGADAAVGLNRVLAAIDKDEEELRSLFGFLFKASNKRKRDAE